MKEIAALVIIGFLVLSLVYPLALAQGQDDGQDGDDELPPTDGTNPAPGAGEHVGGENESTTDNTTGGAGGQPFPTTTLALVVVVLVIIGAVVALLAKFRKSEELPLIPP